MLLFSFSFSLQMMNSRIIKYLLYIQYKVLGLSQWKRLLALEDPRSSGNPEVRQWKCSQQTFKIKAMRSILPSGLINCFEKD